MVTAAKLPPVTAQFVKLDAIRRDGGMQPRAGIDPAYVQELAAAIESSRTGRSAWRIFMIAALVFLLLECLLADRMLSRGRAKADEPSSNPVPENA